MNSLISRRNFIISSTAALTTVAISKSPVQAQQFQCRQFHNQPENSPLHKALVELWAAVKTETGGRFVVQTFAQNNNIPGSDPEALKMLVSGELEFFTLMGGILGKVVPVAEMQGLPFVFKDTQHVLSIMDGSFGTYLQKEMAAKGIHGFLKGSFDNGFRQIGSKSHPIRTSDDLIGLKIRVPDSPMFIDLFKVLGTDPKVINVAQLYQSIKSGMVDAQENALVVMELFNLYEVQKYLSMTNHMWSGFNLIANLKFWNSVPNDIQAILQRNGIKYVALQRRQQSQASAAAVEQLTRYGMVVNSVDTSSFRPRLGHFYTRWKQHFGTTAWNLLEAQVGKIG